MFRDGFNQHAEFKVEETNLREPRSSENRVHQERWKGVWSFATPISV